MKQMRNFKLFLVICTLMVTLSACNKNEPRNSDILQNSPSATQQTQVGTAETYESDPKETNISTILSSGVEVKADVEISDRVNIEQLVTYDAQIVKLNYELLKQLLLANKEIVEEGSSELAEARTDSLFHYCITSDEFSLTYRGEGFSYGNSQYPLIQNILNSREIDIEQFRDSGDLGFLTREEAKQNIENTLKQLNLEVEETPTCYTLSFASLQTICEKLNATRRELMGENSPVHTFVCSDTDACYIFIYQITTEGLPISTHSNGVFGDGSWTSGTSLYCIYSEAGIVGMWLPYSLHVTGQTSQTAHGLSARQVLERLDDKFNSMILDGDYQVNKIEFEYAPMPINGSRSLFQLIPAWRISVFHTFQFADEKNVGIIHSAEEQFDVVFHAITGEELISSLA